jgi:hypothetical protein
MFYQTARKQDFPGGCYVHDWEVVCTLLNYQLAGFSRSVSSKGDFK